MKLLLYFSFFPLFLITACQSEQLASLLSDCSPDDVEVVAYGEYIDIEEGALCFYATELANSSIFYRLNRDGSTENLPLIPWSAMSLRLSFTGEDPQNSYFTVYLQNSVLDSAEAFSSPPVPLTAELILERLLAPGEYPIVGLGIHGRGNDARVDFSNDRFAGYSYNGYNMMADAGSVTITSSSLTTNTAGEPVFELELNFEVLIRQFYDQNSWRELRNGYLNVSIPVADLIPG